MPMTYGFVSVAVADLWTEPRAESERTNQALWCELVRIGERQNGFVECRLEDGYRGWLDSRFLTSITRSEFEAYRRKPRAVVVSKTTAIGPVDPTGNLPHFAFFGTRLVVSLKGSDLIGLLPGGTRVRLKSAGVTPIPENIGPGQLASIVTTARRFLGTPYLWGGITPFGYDCSGMIQFLLRRFGVDLPRDTKEMIAVGRKVDRASITRGDLLFFERHVALSLDADRFIHSSRAGAGVRINSLTPGAPDYRADLDTTFQLARRLPCFT